MRIVSFIDGFTSNSTPSVTGGSQENFTVLNNAALTTILTLDGALYKSAFIDYELERLSTGSTFRQAGSMILSYDGSVWSLNTGNFQGSELIQDTITLPEHITLSVSTALGVCTLSYTSGNMSPTYSGNLKMYITRIVSV